MFLPRALPFGASSSVRSFNRVARALQALLNSLVVAMASNYFDDFPTLEVKELASSTKESCHQLLSLLGWRAALEEKNNKDFEASFTALGVVVDFSNTH